MAARIRLLRAIRSMQIPEPNLYFVGFMGTGKTTVGRAVAQRMGFQLIDSDVAIEQQAGKSIQEIFLSEGEPAFRTMERAFVENGHPATNCVVACGGGLVVQPGMVELLKSKGVVICLFASLETILSRTQGSRHRPLLNVEDQMERIRTLYTQREPIYKKSGTMVLTDGRQLNDIADHVIRIYRREAGEFGK